MGFQVRDYVKKYASQELYDKIVQKEKETTPTNGAAKSDEDGSDLSETSDIEPMEDDEEEKA